jgi:hypothetical protein
MRHNAAILDQPVPRPDYSLTGVNAAQAIEKGLAEADWYQRPVPLQPDAPVVGCSGKADRV